MKKFIVLAAAASSVLCFAHAANLNKSTPATNQAHPTTHSDVIKVPEFNCINPDFRCKVCLNPEIAKNQIRIEATDNFIKTLKCLVTNKILRLRANRSMILSQIPVIHVNPELNSEGPLEFKGWAHYVFEENHWYPNLNLVFSEGAHLKGTINVKGALYLRLKDYAQCQANIRARALNLTMSEKTECTNSMTSKNMRISIDDDAHCTSHITTNNLKITANNKATAKLTGIAANQYRNIPRDMNIDCSQLIGRKKIKRDLIHHH